MSADSAASGDRQVIELVSDWGQELLGQVACYAMLMHGIGQPVIGLNASPVKGKMPVDQALICGMHVVQPHDKAYPTLRSGPLVFHIAPMI